MVVRRSELVPKESLSDSLPLIPNAPVVRLHVTVEWMGRITEAIDLKIKL